MIKRVLSIESNIGAIEEKELKKRVEAHLRANKIKPKQSLAIYFNTLEWKCYCVIDGSTQVTVDLEVK